MTTYPNCKINLGLHVMRRREDGYHDLESIFLPVPLCDELTIEKNTSGGYTEIIQEGIVLDNNPNDNLCMKAYRLMHDEYGIPPVCIRLKKNIPFGAGLGGGSSDAAFTLRMLNELFALGLDNNSLKMTAARIGADCTFFVDNQPAYVTGIGDIIEPLGVNPTAPFRLVLVKPDTAVSTAEAYRGIVPRNRREGIADCDLRQAVQQPIEQWRTTIVNDFEATVFAAHPELADIKQQLYDSGALYASMSGSGSAIFALFPNNSHPKLPSELKQITILS